MTCAAPARHSHPWPPPSPPRPLPTDAPPITFVVVQKRHHTRLFPQPQDQQNRDRSGNILPGGWRHEWVGGWVAGWWADAVVEAPLLSRFADASLQSAHAAPCNAGTVVDGAITHPFEFDFYLNSHAGIQGTSRQGCRGLWGWSWAVGGTLYLATWRA